MQNNFIKNLLNCRIVNELRNLVSAFDIAKNIDEFKGNSGNYKYQVALIEGKTHEVVNILECRHKHFHFARYACDVVNDIRIEVQKNLPQKERKYF